MHEDNDPGRVLADLLEELKPQLTASQDRVLGEALYTASERNLLELGSISADDALKIYSMVVWAMCGPSAESVAAIRM